MKQRKPPAASLTTIAGQRIVGPKAKQAVYWSGDAIACDMCGQSFKDTFIDGKTAQGPWGQLDLKCHRMHGIGLGTGKGQMYRRQEDGRWLKVEG